MTEQAAADFAQNTIVSSLVQLACLKQQPPRSKHVNAACLGKLDLAHLELINALSGDCPA